MFFNHPYCWIQELTVLYKSFSHPQKTRADSVGNGLMGHGESRDEESSSQPMYPLPPNSPYTFRRRASEYLEPVGEFQEFQSAEGNSRQVLMHAGPPRTGYCASQETGGVLPGLSRERDCSRSQRRRIFEWMATLLEATQPDRSLALWPLEGTRPRRAGEQLYVSRGLLSCTQRMRDL